MSFQVAEALEILERTPQVLRQLLAGVSGSWASARERDDSWSLFDIVGHLIHGENTDWIPRARIILKDGKTTPFAPFDRFAQRETSAGKTLGEVLGVFAELRAQNVQTLQKMHLTPEQLRLEGTHPELGTVTLEELLATWVVHDLNHINQITRALAARYRESVGPWNHPDYLRILQGT
ncbi:MAG: DinB family protein [Candidatus Krumholzibacteriia bacterium]